MAKASCIDCGRPGVWTCDRCKAERNRLHQLHMAYQRAMGCPADEAERARRVEWYAKLVSGGAVLFEVAIP